MSGPVVRMIVSIDTEEDNWAQVRHGVTTHNIDALPGMEREFERLGVRATYFSAYQVLADQRARGIMASIHASGRAQVAAHLHPWNTPPFTDDTATMLLNLPEAVQAAKLASLTDSLAALIGSHPTTFRAGRFGLGAATVRLLIAAGYTIDSSVTPMRSWQAHDNGPSFIGAPWHMYRTDGSCDPIHAVGRGLVEVPVSAGYHRGSMRTWMRSHAFLHGRFARRLRFPGLAARLGVARSVILSPEVQTVREMEQLSQLLIQGGVPFLHAFWHSQSLTPGMSPFARTARDVDRMRGRFVDYLDRLAGRATLRFATVREAVADWMATSGGAHEPSEPSHHGPRSRGGAATDRPADAVFRRTSS